MKKELSIYVIISIAIIFYIIYLLSQICVTVDFKELEPFKGSLPVFYKGFRLGHTSRVYPGPDYQSTRVDLKIRLQNLELPANTYAIIRRKDKKDYIELLYPDSPYLANLKNNSLIEGQKGINFETYIQDQAKNGGLDEIKENLNGTIAAAGQTFDALTEMLNVLTSIMNDIKPSIRESAGNLTITTRNLADMSYDIKDSVRGDYISTTLANLEETSANLVLTTQNITGITGSINNTSVNMINCVIQNINIVINNVNEIIIGIGNTLKKRFGGLRLIFGQTISTKN